MKNSKLMIAVLAAGTLSIVFPSCQPDTITPPDPNLFDSIWSNPYDSTGTYNDNPNDSTNWDNSDSTDWGGGTDTTTWWGTDTTDWGGGGSTDTTDWGGGLDSTNFGG